MKRRQYKKRIDNKKNTVRPRYGDWLQWKQLMHQWCSENTIAVLSSQSTNEGQHSDKDRSVLCLIDILRHLVMLRVYKVPIFQSSSLFNIVDTLYVRMLKLNIFLKHSQSSTVWWKRMFIWLASFRTLEWSKKCKIVFHFLRKFQLRLFLFDLWTVLVRMVCFTCCLRLIPSLHTFR